LAAEVLYGKVGELASIDDNTGTVLDVCCGTGTIGLSIAKVFYIYQYIFNNA
jgi:methylase of polypeptide subunit release factors